MRDPWVKLYLQEKVIDFLKEHDIGYLKIDYNENFGIGFDGASFGEESRQQLEASQQFIREIQKAAPGLVIENCSSGGHPKRRFNATPVLFYDQHLLGRMCLSGDINELSETQWAVIEECRAFYEECKLLIKRDRRKFFVMKFYLIVNPMAVRLSIALTKTKHCWSFIISIKL